MEFCVNFLSKVSAKLGIGIDEVFEAIIKRLPFPKVNRSGPLKALLFDSWYHRYRGVLCLIFVKEGCVTVGDNITFCHTKKEYEVKTLSVLRPGEENVNQL